MVKVSNTLVTGTAVFRLGTSGTKTHTHAHTHTRWSVQLSKLLELSSGRVQRILSVASNCETQNDDKICNLLFRLISEKPKKKTV